MPNGTDEIIERNFDGGKPAFDADSDAANRNESGTDADRFEPEVISGYETEEPRTERFSDAGTGTTTGRKPRRDAGQPRGKRGPNKRTTGEKESVRLESISLTDLFYSLTMMGASIIHRPELEIDKDEAKRIAEAAQEVGKHYTTAFDPKKIAILNLIAVLISIFWLRCLAIKNNLERERQEKRVRIEGQATPIRPAPSAMREPNAQQADQYAMPTPSTIFGDQTGTL